MNPVRPVSFKIASACFLSFSLLSAPSSTAQTADKPAVQPPASPTPYVAPTDSKYLAAMAEAKQLVHDRQYFFAMEKYKKANKIAGGKDRDSLDKLIDLQFRFGEYKDAVNTATMLEAIAATPKEKSKAEADRGEAIFLEAGDKNKLDKLQAADAALKQAIEDNPRNGNAHFFDGKVLARMQQMEAASEQFKQCLACVSPNDPSYVRAQHFADNPQLSTAKMAPPVVVTALDGSHFNLDEMGGRVVLIDFWATWCGPCNAELPHIKKIAKEFAGQPLVIISISWDSDETKWKNFIAKNEMTWVQYRDVNHELSKQFDVNAIPHYFTIDSDGVLTSEMLGSGSDVEGKLKKLVAKARSAEPKQSQTVSGTQ